MAARALRPIALGVAAVLTACGMNRTAPPDSVAPASATLGASLAKVVIAPAARPAAPPNDCENEANDRPSRLHACAESCMAREGRACVARAELALADEGPVAIEQAGDFFDRGCHFGVEAGCTRWHALVDEQRERCGATSTDACLLQGKLVTEALGATEPDLVAADASLGVACEANIALGCELRGDLDVVREPAEVFAKLALASFERGCDLGAPRSCCGAADMLAEARATKRDLPGAERLRAHALTLGAGCGVAGSAARPRGVRSTEVRLEATGGLSIEAVAPIVRAAEGRLRECYVRGLARDPALRGAVTTTFGVDASGDAEDMKTASSTIADEGVVGCLRDVYATLKFPAPVGNKGASVVAGMAFGVE